MADTEHSKCFARKGVRVQVPPSARALGRLTSVTDDAQSQPSPPARPTGNAPAKARILVAEDEALIRLDLVEMLVDAGYDVVAQASNGEQAVALSRELKPDLVMMDVRMPVLDGISAAEQIGRKSVV